MRNISSSCLLLQLAHLLAAMLVHTVVVEANYHGRDEYLEITLPGPGPASNGENGSAVELVNATIYVPLPSWLDEPLCPTWLATTVALLSLLGLSCLMALCCLVSRHNLATGEPHEPIARAPLDLCDSNSAGGAPDEKRLLREILLGLEAQWCFFGVACLYAVASGTRHVPGWLLLLAAPWLFRNLYLNFIWCDESRYAALAADGCCKVWWARLQTTAAICLAKLENLDAASDGLAVASAYFLTEEANHRFAASFSSTTGIVGWVCRHLGMGNLMMVSLLYSTLIQGVMAFYEKSEKNFDVLAALAGFPCVVAASATLAEDKVFNALVVALARVCSENVPQALLQTSLVMAKGQSFFEQPVLALSISLSCLSLASKALAMMVNVCDSDARKRVRGCEHVCFCMVQFIPALGTVMALALILLKLYASQACQSRIWGLTTGCVDIY
mmetsp:Transcript_12324/g.28898  ORF Transcript_12324/g.28898 Transcript_12324/m.28898 type:complete len:444 (-) Transcript_12324:13-1344(-)